MYRLIQGQVSEAQIDLLLELTRITSEGRIEAIKLHLVKGYPAPMAYGLCDVAQQNFHSTLEALNRVYVIHERLNELAE
jgi:hypothetical protein